METVPFLTGCWQSCFWDLTSLGKPRCCSGYWEVQLSLPSRIWTRLSALWIGNFTLVGALNLVVAYQYEESFWVAYKLYSSIGFTLLLMLFTIAIVAPHLKDQDAVSNEPAEDSP